MESRNSKSETEVNHLSIQIDEELLEHKKDVQSFSIPPAFIRNWIDRNRDEIITLWDNKGKMVYVSGAVERLLGVDKEKLLGTVWYARIFPDDAKYISHNYKQKLNYSQRFIINLLHKNGKYISTECKVEKLIDPNNNYTYHIVLIKDNTDKRHVEELMIRSEKTSIAGQLAAEIAHEIRNPLTSLKGFLQLLQAGVNHKEEYYHIMLEEIEKMDKITSELLFLSRPLTNNRRKESINTMIDDIVSLLLPQARLKNIEIIVNHPNSYFIQCDRTQIKQVLINLVKNAIESMNEPGEINLNVVSNKSGIEIHVIDEGPGIKDEILDKLGEPFFTTKKSGTGLGLMITKQILDQHHATLKILKNEIKGSIFKLSFPSYN